MQEEKEKIIEIKRTLSELTAKFEDKFDELSKSIGKTVEDCLYGRSIPGRSHRGLHNEKGKMLVQPDHILRLFHPGLLFA